MSFCHLSGHTLLFIFCTFILNHWVSASIKMFVSYQRQFRPRPIKAPEIFNSRIKYFSSSISFCLKPLSFQEYSMRFINHHATNSILRTKLLLLPYTRSPVDDSKQANFNKAPMALDVFMPFRRPHGNLNIQYRLHNYTGDFEHWRTLNVDIVRAFIPYHGLRMDNMPKESSLVDAKVNIL